MKILNLSFGAFGPFTGAHIDLAQGQSGLHLIYGPNEAGKSSSLRAITHLLFGFPSSTDDDFIHPYGKLRVGGRLQHSDGSTLDLIRRKSRKNSLRAGNDTDPVDESELTRFLGDVDCDLFEMMFGLDHQRLTEGGRQIANGSGRIGQMLFAAGSGLGDLQGIQSELQQKTDALLKSSGRSGSIHEGIKKFLELKKSVAAAQVSIETWKKHTSALKAANHQKKLLVDKIRDLQSQQNRLRRIKSAIPIIVSWKKSAAAMAELEHVPLLAASFAAESQQVLTDLAATELQLNDANHALEKNAKAMESVVVPEILLSDSDTIEALRDRVGRYRDAIADRPGLESRRDAAESEAKEVLRQLGRKPDLSTIEELRMPADKTVRIQELGNQHDGLFEKLKSSKRESEKLRRDIEANEKKLADLPATNAGSSLKATLHAIQRHGDLDSELEQYHREMDTLEENAKLDLERLPLWTGNLSAVAALPVLSRQTIDRFNEQFHGCRQQLAALLRRQKELVDQRQRLDDELLQLEKDQAVPTKDQLATARKLRELGWKHVIDAWGSGQTPNESLFDDDELVDQFPNAVNLPDAYSRSVQSADQIADALRTDADRVANKTKLQFDRERGLAQEQSLEEEIADANAQCEVKEQEWRHAWNPIGVTPLSPAEMLEWVRQQDSILQQVKQLSEFRRKAQQTRQLMESLGQQLREALATVDPELSIGNRSLSERTTALVEACDEIQSTATRREQLEELLQSQRHDLADAEARFVEAASAVAQWRSDWSAEMKRMGLEDNSLPSQANSFLSDTANLFQKYRDADRFRSRVEHIDRDARKFESDVRELTLWVAPDLKDSAADQAITVLTARLQTARDSAQRKKSLEQQSLEQQSKRSTASEKIAGFKIILDQWCRQSGCDRYDQLSPAATRSEKRRELERSVQEWENQIIAQSGGVELESFVADVESESVEVDSIQPRIDEREHEIERLNNQRDELTREIEREEAELRKIDGSGLAAEQELKCQSLSARLEDEVQRLAVLRVASTILGVAIEQYRKKNQGPVLNRASAIFSRCTLGSFSSLRAEFDDKGEPVLVGVRETSGETVPISGMSDGTCDQLYLALRLASLENWLDHHEPVPLIVDDVLLNFDDDRSIETLKVLAELSRRTQIVFFTHHQHLVEIAINNLQSQDLFVTRIAENRG